MTEKDFNLSCPLPLTDRKTIVLGHGSGGRLSAQLMRELFLPAFDNEILRKLDDQAVLTAGSERIAFTTDSFVVTPLFFPGGDIGQLAVNGTVNDLAMRCATALSLRRLYSGRRFPDRSTKARDRVDGKGGTSGGSHHRDRRYEGRE